MNIGYARVSTKDQNLDLQIEALKKVGCEIIFKEKVSGATKNRPELDKMIAHLRKDDVVYVWRLDRLGRSLKHIIDLVLELNSKEIVIKGISDGVDTSTMSGRLFLNIMENILWSRCVSVMTSHTAHSLCSLAVTDSGAIIL